MGTKDALNLVLSVIKDAMESLPKNERLKAEIPVSIEDYKLSHPNGALLVVYRGSEYENADVTGYVVQKRNMEIGVILIVRKKQSGKTPEEYIDFVLSALSGVTIEGLTFNKKKIFR